MRNDARPIGEDSPASPVGGNEGPAADHPASDSRDSLKHDRQSHIVHPQTEKDAKRGDHDSDPTLPTGDSTLNTKI